MNKIDKALGFMKLLRGDDEHEIWMVGGSVRDMVVGLEPVDIDFTTPKTPEEIKEILMKRGVFKRSIDMVDSKVGTVVVTYADEVYEITTFRKETYIPGNRRPVVEFTTDIYEDALRRDFNVNSIYWDGEHNFFDPMKGLAYADNGQVIPGELNHHLTTNVDAIHSYCRDPLRVLRFYRMSTKFGMIEEDVPSLESLQNILSLSFQTLRKEMEKCMTKPMYHRYLQEGIYRLVIPYFTEGERHLHGVFFNDDLFQNWANLLKEHIGPSYLIPQSRINLIKKSLRMMEFSKEDIEKIVQATGL